ncbi:hypothetical protein PFISCL1PPCAC_732, partial [Pristionchus fissidentatus]
FVLLLSNASDNHNSCLRGDRECGVSQTSLLRRKIEETILLDSSLGQIVLVIIHIGSDVARDILIVNLSVGLASHRITRRHSGRFEHERHEGGRANDRKSLGRWTNGTLRLSARRLHHGKIARRLDGGAVARRTVRHGSTLLRLLLLLPLADGRLAHALLRRTRRPLQLAALALDCGGSCLVILEDGRSVRLLFLLRTTISRAELIFLGSTGDLGNLGGGRLLFSLFHPLQLPFLDPAISQLHLFSSSSRCSPSR